MTDPMQRTTPDSVVNARVKFAFSSRVVQPTPASIVVTNASPHGRVHQCHRQPCVDDADRVVVELGGLALEDRVPRARLDEAEPERLGDRGRR